MNDFSAWQFALGIILVTIVNIDFLWTSLSMAGAGPVALRLGRITGSGLAALLPRRAAPAIGPIALTIIFTWWVFVLWLGWTFMFLADPGVVVSSSTREPADAWEVAYYAGFALSTLGVGDFVVTKDAWRLATVLAALNGLSLITLGITYIVSVFQSLVEQRALARQIRTLGRSPEEILAWGWSDGDFSRLIQALGSLSAELLSMEARERAFPVIHEYVPADPRTAIGHAIPLLEDALALLACTRPGDDLLAGDLRPLDRSLEVFLSGCAGSGTAEIRPLDFAALEAAGIPLKPAAERQAALQRRDGRRKQACAFAGHCHAVYP